eukprot:gene14430-19366_t
MVRGHAKLVAQEKSANRAADKAKSVKRDGSESKQIREAGIALSCSVCKQGMANIGVLRTHFENRHPRSPLPPELASEADAK